MPIDRDIQPYRTARHAPKSHSPARTSYRRDSKNRSDDELDAHLRFHGCWLWRGRRSHRDVILRCIDRDAASCVSRPFHLDSSMIQSVSYVHSFSSGGRAKGRPTARAMDVKCGAHGAISLAGPVEGPSTRPMPKLGEIKGVLFDIDGGCQHAVAESCSFLFLCLRLLHIESRVE